MSRDPTSEAARLRTTFARGTTRPVPWRLEQLAGLGRLLHEQRVAIEAAIGRDLGRGRTEAFLAEIYAVQGELAALRRGLRRWSRPEGVPSPFVLWPARSIVRHEPLGVVLVIGPWNYPFNLVLAPLAAALAAGNCVLVKPSEHAPASSALLAELLPRYVDPEAVAVVEGDASTAEAAIDAPVDHVFFTGGAVIGRLIAERAARHLTPVTLELGGKSPAIVTDSADVQVAARRIAWGKLINAGQSCIAPDYVLATTAVAPRFCDALVAAIQEFYGNDPKASPDLGRIVDDRHLERLASLLDGHGGRVLIGGEVDAAERYVAPTVVLDPALKAPLMEEEIFGPILPVVTVEDVAAATAFVAARPAPLACYVFTGDRRDATTVVEGTRSGSICVNTTVHHFASPHLPFGGVGASGYGRYHGRYGFETFSHLRPVLTKPPRPDPGIGRPPYGRWTARALLAVLDRSGRRLGR